MFSEKGRAKFEGGMEARGETVLAGWEEKETWEGYAGEKISKIMSR
jgi:hypothetical protein